LALGLTELCYHTFLKAFIINIKKQIYASKGNSEVHPQFLVDGVLDVDV
jgi:hypothetical protein